MFDIVNAKLQFSKLSKEAKFVKLEAILSLVESSLGTYSDILQHLSSQGSRLPEETLIAYHNLILSDISMLQGDSLDVFVDELKKLQESLKKQSRDTSITTDQNDAENLLNTLYI